MRRSTRTINKKCTKKLLAIKWNIMKVVLTIAYTKLFYFNTYKSILDNYFFAIIIEGLYTFKYFNISRYL